MTPVERLLRRTEVVDGHLLWRGASSARNAGKGRVRDENHRYGLIYYQGRLRPAHVVAHLEMVGPIPLGYQVHHICEVTLCWRPDHLLATTPRGNLMASDTPARRNAEKTHCKRGHEFTPENTRLKSLRGGRSIVRACKTCERSYGNEWRAQHREHVNALQRGRRLANGRSDRA